MAIANRRSKIENGHDASGYGLRDNNSSGALFDTPLFAPTAPIENQKSKIENPPPLPQAVEVAALASDGRRKRILQLLLNCGPLTIHEMCDAFTYGQTVTTPNQISGRLTDLKREALIDTIGQRPSPSGCGSDVLAINDRGRVELLRMKRT